MTTHSPFDFSAAMTRLCEDVTGRVAIFRHIRMNEVLVSFAQARRRVPHGLQAKLTPMRFENGRLTTIRGGRTWTVQRLYVPDHQEVPRRDPVGRAHEMGGHEADESHRGQREILYILTFYLPRFLDHCFREKMITVFHELYHISPLFDGDIRRMGGRCHVHSHSQKEYDRQMGVLVDEYLAGRPPKDRFGFLKKRFHILQSEHGGVVGVQVPIPKLIPLPEARSA